MAKVTRQVVPAWRFILVILLLACLASLLIWRVLSLQVLDTERGHEFLRGQGDARTVRTEHIPAYRGVISDRNGEPLAISTPVASIWINPKHIISESDRWAELAGVLGMSRQKLKEKIIQNSRRGFVYLRRHLSPQLADEILALRIKGVNVQREYKRYYPAGEVASHIVGFTNIDDQGQEGMELAFESWLKGESGSKRVLKDLHGNVFRDIGQGVSASSGKDLMLSIDMRLQYLAYRELKAAMKRVEAKSGSVVMLDSQTGEVLAMVNQPSFNPNNRRALKPAHMRNRAMTDMFEPGSTVKPLTVVAALESGRYQPNTVINTSPGYIRVGKKTLVDPVNYGSIDVTSILTKSSQVGTSKIALDLDEQSVWEVFSRFGLGVSTGSSFPGESAGLLPGRPNWRPIERVNFAFGYGLTVTPLQLAQAYSVFASGGVLRPATLLRQEQVEKGEQIISEKVAGQLVDMLKTVTGEDGTAKRARVASYSVAGKTGTVHKVSDKGGYADNRYMAVFAGLAPASEPRIVTVVMIDEPNLDKYHGGESAAPVFSRVVTDALRILDVTPDKALPVNRLVNGKPVKGRRKSA
ncbi:MAG: penicillin-binding protein 2 [Oceanicoccus sp.]|uniref:peptidoglycan D,D-transpeptidase FtsI family protein n=1 Tax=Oceanicoccus sp. TaxID=2691044 RepID=UPI002618E328|nr:penicillin-binding transpeptidase domain-containing protein [Oceanicoccus sp.]MCP3906652.1 penicillin-binding protein 2 [Oceanicoccus sp.]MDG1773177.1 penicillin-binding transpeptidase domain-containing protein [Oceanicoccus sp.]